MSKTKLLTGAALVVATGMLPVSQAQAEVDISGWINQSVTYADDGGTSDIISSADNGTTLGSRITFSGSSDLANSGLNAGFEVILEPRTDGDGLLGFGSGATGPGAPSNVDAFAGANGDTINVLGHSVNVGGAFGKFTLGLQSMPTDNIAVLADPSLTLWASISPVFRGNAIALNGGGAAGGAFGNYLTCYTAEVLSDGLGIGIDCNGIYRQGVRYDLPTFLDGLNIAASWSNDEVYDVAAKYNTQLGRINTILHLGYAQNNNSGANLAGSRQFDSAENIQAQLGLLDPVTGLFGTLAYQYEDADLLTGATVEGETDAYWVKVGVKRAFTALGDTSIAFQYGSYNDQYGFAQGAAGVTGSELERLGVEINQYFGSKLIVYGSYENLDVEADGSTAAVTAINGADDLDLFVLGLTYFF